MRLTEFRWHLKMIFRGVVSLFATYENRSDGEYLLSGKRRFMCHLTCMKLRNELNLEKMAYDLCVNKYALSSLLQTAYVQI